MRGEMWNFIHRRIDQRDTYLSHSSLLKTPSLVCLAVKQYKNGVLGGGEVKSAILMSDEASDLQFSLIIEYYDNWKRMGLLRM